MRVCLLLMKTPSSDEDAERMLGILRGAKAQGTEIAVYLLGDGVLCARKGQTGYVGLNLGNVPERTTVRASTRDLRARGISDGDLEPGVEIIEDLEGVFIEDVMEKAERVFTW
jgi:sulfur relay protein TusB/DsrH